MIKGLKRARRMLDGTLHFFRVPKKVKYGYSNVIEPNFKDQCLAVGVPFFFKQWGGFNKKRRGRLLDGRTWDGMPVFEDLEIMRS
jgi:hypothetical protein